MHAKFSLDRENLALVSLTTARFSFSQAKFTMLKGKFSSCKAKFLLFCRKFSNTNGKFSFDKLNLHLIQLNFSAEKEI